MSNETDILISRLSAVSDDRVSGLVAPDTRHDLAERIMATPVEDARPVRSGGLRRRLLFGVSVAAGLTAATVAIASLSSSNGSSDPSRPAVKRVQLAAALSFSAPDSGYITVVIKDPYADPARYQKEFAAHGMRIELLLVPASPSVVGTLVGSGGAGPKLAPGQSKKDVKEEPRPDKREIINITSKSACQTPGGGDCIIGVKVPVGYRNHDMLVFGRAARPGEPYKTTNLATAPGELLHGLVIRNRTVADVLAMLKARHVTVAAYRAAGSVGANGGVTMTSPDSVPGTWYVTDADPYADHQVMLFVAAKPHFTVAAPQPR